MLIFIKNWVDYLSVQFFFVYLSQKWENYV